MSLQTVTGSLLTNIPHKDKYDLIRNRITQNLTDPHRWLGCSIHCMATGTNFKRAKTYCSSKVKTRFVCKAISRLQRGL